MDIYTIQSRLEELFSQVAVITKSYHEAKTEYENLDELKKQVLAAISMKYDGSEAKIKRMSLASDDWKEYLKGLNSARSVYNEAWVRLEGLRIKMDILRSINKHLS